MAKVKVVRGRFLTQPLFLCLQVQFFIWWGMNMCLGEGGVGKHLSYIRICWAKFSGGVQLSNCPEWVQNTAKWSMWFWGFLVLAKCSSEVAEEIRLSCLYSTVQGVFFLYTSFLNQHLCLSRRCIYSPYGFLPCPQKQWHHLIIFRFWVL